MNKVILMGRLTRDPDVRFTNNEKPMCIARYTLAVDRKIKRDGEPTADFIPCAVFGKSAQFAEKYFRKGTKLVITGRIQTGLYNNKDGVKVFKMEVIVEDQEFAESKATQTQTNEMNVTPFPQPQQATKTADDFANIMPDDPGIGLPFE